MKFDLIKMLTNERDHNRRVLARNMDMADNATEDIRALRYWLTVAAKEDRDAELHRLLENTFFYLFRSNALSINRLCEHFGIVYAAFYITSRYDGGRTFALATADISQFPSADAPEEEIKRRVPDSPMLSHDFESQITELLETDFYPRLAQIISPRQTEDDDIPALVVRINGSIYEVDYAFLPEATFDNAAYQALIIPGPRTI